MQKEGDFVFAFKIVRVSTCSDRPIATAEQVKINNVASDLLFASDLKSPSSHHIRRC